MGHQGWFFATHQEKQDPGGPKAPSVQCPVSTLSGLGPAVQGAAHITSPLLRGKKALGPGQSGRKDLCPHLLGPPGSQGQTGRESCLLTLGTGHIGTAFWQGHLARLGAASQRIRQEHNLNFQGVLFRHRAYPFLQRCQESGDSPSSVESSRKFQTSPKVLRPEPAIPTYTASPCSQRSSVS